MVRVVSAAGHPEVPTQSLEVHIGMLDALWSLSCKFRFEFIRLLGLLIIQIAVSFFSVVSIIPLSDIVLNPESSSQHIVTKRLEEYLQPFGLEVGFLLCASLFVFTNGLKAVSDLLTHYYIFRMKYVVHRVLSLELIGNLFGAKCTYLSSYTEGKIINTLNHEMTKVAESLCYIAQQMASVVQLVVFVSIPLTVSVELTLMSLLLAVIAALPFFLLYKKSFVLGKLDTKTANKYNEIISEIFYLRRLNKIQSLEKYVTNTVGVAHEQHVKVALPSQVLKASITYLYYPLALAATLCAIGVYLEETSVAVIAIFLWSFVRAMPVIAKILQTNLNMLNFLPAYQQVYQINGYAKVNAELSGSKHFNVLQRAVSIKNLSFAYDEQQLILREANMEIEKGKITVLIGPSGSGKSTIVDVLLGLRDVKQGQVLIDGINLRNFNTKSWRKKIGYVGQDPQLRHMTIRDNLTFGLNEVSDDEISNALDRANAAEIVVKQKHGLQSVVGGVGGNLSGGEKQRLNIARALLRSPEILIFDEATNQQDGESVEKIKQTIKNLSSELAILFITHQSDVLEIADVVYRVEQNTLVRI